MLGSSPWQRGEGKGVKNGRPKRKHWAAHRSGSSVPRATGLGMGRAPDAGGRQRRERKDKDDEAGVEARKRRGAKDPGGEGWTTFDNQASYVLHFGWFGITSSVVFETGKEVGGRYRIFFASTLDQASGMVSLQTPHWASGSRWVYYAKSDGACAGNTACAERGRFYHPSD